MTIFKKYGSIYTDAINSTIFKQQLFYSYTLKSPYGESYKWNSSDYQTDSFRNRRITYVVHIYRGRRWSNG